MAGPSGPCRLYEGLLEPVLDQIGSKQLREVSAGDIRAALGQLTTRYSTRSLQITRNALERAIRHAEANDLVGRNVAALVKPPRGRAGRPSKSFTVEQAKALLAAAEGTRWHAYVALSLLSGIRTEEARALRWDHVVRWMGEAEGWQPVTSAGFDRADGEEPVRHLRLAGTAARGRHQDWEVTADAGAAAAVR